MCISGFMEEISHTLVISAVGGFLANSISYHIRESTYLKTKIRHAEDHSHARNKFKRIHLCVHAISVSL